MERDNTASSSSSSSNALTTTTAAVAAMPTMRGSADTVVTAFIEMMHQFLDAMQEVFPECERVRSYKFGLDVSLRGGSGGGGGADGPVARQIIEGYHASMAPYYKRCMDHDETLLSENIDLMINIDLPQKWSPDLHPDTRAAIWEYITKLNEFSNIYAMYAQIPRGMLSSIESIAHGIAAQISDGTMSMGDLNLQTMSEQVMSSLSAADLEEFATRMQDGGGGASNIVENMTTMCSMMSNFMHAQNM